MIRVENVTKTFKNGEDILYANNDISISFETGMIALVGKSGSGKTTLLNIIGGLLTPSKGKVLIDGEDITNFDNKQVATFRNQKIGFVFQSFYLEDSYSVYQNAELPLIIAKVKKEERRNRVIEALKIVDMEEKIDMQTINLSGGEKQRLAIARAIINHPQILLCDEPTGNLDVTNSKIVMDYLRKLADQGILIILVTHNLEYAKIADRIIKISDGKIQ